MLKNEETLDLAVAIVVGILALLIAWSSASFIAETRGPQFDVILGPIAQQTQGAFAWIVGTVSGAVAVFCALRVWKGLRPRSGSDRVTLQTLIHGARSSKQTHSSGQTDIPQRRRRNTGGKQ